MNGQQLFSGIDVRIGRDGRRVLLSDCRWQETYGCDEVTYTALRGMVYDGPSIPMLFRWLYSTHVEVAAALHDWLYATHADDSGGVVSRRRADRVMLRCSKVCQRRARQSGAAPRVSVLVHWVQRWLIWAGLRVGGWWAWRKSWGRKLIVPI